MEAISRAFSRYETEGRPVWIVFSLKLFGERIISRDPDRQAAEIHIRIAIMNRFSALGRAEIKAIA